MSFDEIFVHEWEPELMAEEVRKQSIYNAKQEKAIETAMHMLKDKMPLKMIAKYTGLSLQSIKTLKTQL